MTDYCETAPQLYYLCLKEPEGIGVDDIEFTRYANRVRERSAAWAPPPVRWSDEGVSSLARADVLSFSKSYPLLSDRLVDRFRVDLLTCGDLLPVTVEPDGSRCWFLNCSVTAPSRLVNRGRRRYERVVKVSVADQYEVRPEFAPRVPTFRVPGDRREILLWRGEFVDALTKWGAIGVKTRRCWPPDPVPPVETVQPPVDVRTVAQQELESLRAVAAEGGVELGVADEAPLTAVAAAILKRISVLARRDDYDDRCLRWGARLGFAITSRLGWTWLHATWKSGGRQYVVAPGNRAVCVAPIDLVDRAGAGTSNLLLVVRLLIAGEVPTAGRSEMRRLS